MNLIDLQRLLILPGAVLDVAHKADAATLRVLLWIAEDLTLCQKPTQLARLSGTDGAGVEKALTFWRDAGILPGATVTVPAKKSGKKQPAKEAPSADEDTVAVSAKVLSRVEELPNYTTGELAEILEGRESFRLLLVEAQNIIGKVFNTADTNVMVGLYDHLGFSEEYILRFLAHCRTMEKKSMRTIEKYAISLADRGISTPEALEEEIRTAEALHSREGEIRRLFGLGQRSLTAKEKGYLRDWFSWGYAHDVIELAYEATVNATGKGALPYANSILKRWHEMGWNNADAIRAGVAEERAEKETKTQETGLLGHSFDTDSILEAALARGFRERRED